MQERENAAFSGYCAGVAFAMAWNGKLESFSAFYQIPKETEPAPTTEDHIEMMRRVGEGGPPLSD